MQRKISLHTKDTDANLFRLIKRQNKKAFTEIYNKYHEYLYFLALRFLKDEEMAEDAVQYVFVKLWITASDINIEINLKNYLYSMTKNYILNQIRDNKNIISMNYENYQLDIKDEGNNALNIIEETELKDLLYEGINNLPNQKKEICKKKIEENKSNQEIANEMGITINTVKSHYQEAVKMLRTHFKKIRMMIL